MANLNETPKQNFQSQPGALAAHRRYFESEATREFLNCAMMEYHRKLAIPSPEKPSAKHWKMVGAMEFVKELLNLSEQSQQTKREDTSNLNHRA